MLRGANTTKTFRLECGAQFNAIALECPWFYQGLGNKFRCEVVYLCRRASTPKPLCERRTLLVPGSHLASRPGSRPAVACAHGACELSF
jgi:hypothetical protein